MLRVTRRARETLKRTVLRDIAESGVSLRLVGSGPGTLGLVRDRAKPGDQVVEHEGATVLLVERGLAERLDGLGLDCRDTPEGARLTIVRPRIRRDTGQRSA